MPSKRCRSIPAARLIPNSPLWPGRFKKAAITPATPANGTTTAIRRKGGYTTTSGLYSSGGGKGITQPEIDDRGRPLTGYRGWTFKDADNKAELDKGVGLQPDNSRHIADGAIRAIQTAPKDKPWLVHVNFAFPHDPRQWPAGMKNRYDAAKMPLPANFAQGSPFRSRQHRRTRRAAPAADATRRERGARGTGALLRDDHRSRRAARPHPRRAAVV
jgi:hypothetical protein